MDAQMFTSGCCRSGRDEGRSSGNPRSRPRLGLSDQALAWVEQRWADSEGMRQWVRRFCEAHVTFYRLHLAYFIVLATGATLLLWLSPKPSGPIALIDALFSVGSSLCLTGMFSLRMHRLSLFDKVVLMFLMVLGSQVFTSLLPVYVRRFYFKRYIRTYLSPNSKQAQGITASAEDDVEKDVCVDEVPVRGRARPWKAASQGNVFDKNGKFVGFKPPEAWLEDEHTHGHTWSGETFRKEAQKFALVMHISKAVNSRFEERQRKEYHSREGEAGDEEDDTFELDASRSSKVLEYRALMCLSWLVPIYLLGVLLTSFVLIELYFLDAPGARQALKERDVDASFFAMFITISAFANAGVSLVDESMVPFQRSAILLIILTVVILVGNTLFPACMRCIIWLLYRGSPKGSRWKPVFKYLLRHPRKCYTHLFPRSHTIWIFITVMVLNAVEIGAFCALDWRSTALKGLGPGYKVVDGMFQSASSRSAGLQVVALAQLSSGMLVLIVGMMYVAAYPIFLSRQNSIVPREVYDEADLGVYGRNWEAELVQSRLSWQARALLARDSVYLFVAVLLICAIHNHQTKEDPLNFSIFNVIFEVISAYGTVGLSMGYSCDLARMIQPNVACEDVPYAFSGKWSPAGKVVLVVVMFLGRHRGLPDNIDSAVQLPRRKEFSVAATRHGSLSTFGDTAGVWPWDTLGGGRGPAEAAYSPSSSHLKQVLQASGETITGTPVSAQKESDQHRNSLSPPRCSEVAREEII